MRRIRREVGSDLGFDDIPSPVSLVNSDGVVVRNDRRSNVTVVPPDGRKPWARLVLVLRRTIMVGRKKEEALLRMDVGDRADRATGRRRSLKLRVDGICLNVGSLWMEIRRGGTWTSLFPY